MGEHGRRFRHRRLRRCLHGFAARKLSQQSELMGEHAGRETRAVMNAALPSSKVGILDYELNTLSKARFESQFTLV